MFSGILLDIDNTLYNYEGPHQAGMQKVYATARAFGYQNFEEIFNLTRKEIHDELKNTASSHNRLLYFQRILEKYGDTRCSVAKTLTDTYWNEFLNKMVLFDGVIEFLARNNDKKICLITDLTADIQYAKINKLGIFPYIQYIVTSEEVGVEKPNSKMFKTALKKMELQPNEVCMIGDSYEKDIIGAQKLGIKAFWKTEEKYCSNQVTAFNNFHELIGLI